MCFQRSRQKVTQIVDALDEANYMILNIAEVRMHGSINQRHVEPHHAVAHLLQRLDRALSGSPLRDWRQLVDGMLRVYADMLEDSRGFRAIRIGPAHDPYIMQPDEDNVTVIAAGTRELFRGQVGLPDEPRVERVLVVALTMGDALLQLAYRRDPAGDREILAELTSVVTRYLDQELPLSAG